MTKTTAASSNERAAVLLAAKFARRDGRLEPGNLWEPAIARNIAADLRAGASVADVERDWTFRLFGEEA